VNDPRELAAIFVGGMAGALARYGLLEALGRPDGSDWPWATFAANMIGCAVLGWLVTRLQERLPLSAYKRPLVGTGFCGALTTFATLQFEVYDMLDAGNGGLAAAYALVSIAAGFAVVTVASALSRRVRMV
jgi:fluoride exporter